MMVQFKTLCPVFLCVLGLLSQTQSSRSLEAETGANVTIWCQHNLKHPEKIFWHKHTSDSVPLLLGCKRFLTSAPAENCLFFTESERIVMSVNSSNTTLTITAVNVSDTGLYYCSYMKVGQMFFSSSTSLRVKGGNKATSEDPGRVKMFFMLIVVFSAVIVILLSFLIFIILKHRKTRRAL